MDSLCLRASRSSRSLLLVGTTLGLLMATGCSKTNILSSIEIKVSEIQTGGGSDSLVSLGAKLNLGNAVLDSIQLPIRDPRTGVVVGSLALQTAADGKQQVSLGLNASVMFNADPALGRTLPNGRELPLSLGAAPGEILAFPILQHSRVYIGGDLRSRIFMGVALGIQALDGIAGAAGMPVNVFFGQQVGQQIYGLAGLYGSPVANQSGIAVLGRLDVVPSTAPSTNVPITLSSRGVRSRDGNAASRSQAPQGIAARISGQATSDAEALNSRSENKVTRIFYGSSRRVLRVQ